MAVPEDKLAQVMAYCGVVGPETPDVPAPADRLCLDLAWDAAAAYLLEAGVPEPAPEVPRYALWLEVMLAMTLDGFDQRGGQFDAGKLEDNPVFRRKLVQLKVSGLWSE